MTTQTFLTSADRKSARTALPAVGRWVTLEGDALSEIRN